MKHPTQEEIRKKYETRPFKEWDGIVPLCLYYGEKFFYNEDDIDDFLAENEGEKAEDLMLLICEPNYYPEIRYEDLVEDIMPEDWDGDFPKELEKRLTELNTYIKTLKPASWGEGTYRTNYQP